MADAPVDSLRRLLLAPELDEYRTRFLAAVVLMDEQKVKQFEDIPQHCYDRLEALVQVGDAGCGAEVEGGVGDCEDVAAVAASGQDIHDDRDCETTTVFVPALTPEDKVHKDKDCEATAVAVLGGDIYEGEVCKVASEDETPEYITCLTTTPSPATTLNGDIHGDEITAVNFKEHTHEDAVSNIPAPENHNHENTACETIVAIVSITVALRGDACKNTICGITTVASETHTHNGTASKIPTPEDHIHEACEIAAAVVPAADMDTIPDVTMPSKNYTHKYTTSEITVPAEDCIHESEACQSTILKNYTNETTACEIPPTTT